MNVFYRNGGGETAREARRTRLAEIFKDSVEMMQAQDLQESIKASKANTRTYFNENIEFIRPEFGKQTQVTVTNHRTFEAAGLIHERYPDKRIGVLNFASATNPGGGVVWGSSAQEESLCRCSTLYPALNQKNLLVNYYDFHRSRQDSLYTDRCIYTPDVKVIKSDTDYPERLDSTKFFNVDVITCAAPNLRHADPISDAELERLHLKRGRRILDVAVENKIDCLVLGAFGCGAFRNNPQIVARVYAKLMDHIVAAVQLVQHFLIAA